ncbi:hypothetical protein O7635_37530 [Asanoa sp. WMMD1127]|uniref:hypothetical protein n=1 Tax=Asanoa sp. WMMD1127 TaxID=3016107 RepID=UPI0024160327|nr:hypothetical protein [Asanoa sp. WMMD1127]MDG4827578.1 hypothetical protein [Asanoa sp. WMMD1127]
MTSGVGWWRLFVERLGRALRGPEPIPTTVFIPPPPPDTVKVRRQSATPIIVAASGHVFSFNVHATFIWTGHRMHREELSEVAQRLTPFAVRKLTALSAARARQYPAHHARELEIELQDALDGSGEWPYVLDEVRVTCRPYVWVEIEDRVKEAIRPYREKLIQLDCDHDVQMRRAAYAEALSRQWRTVLTELLDDPLADGAAKLTETELANVVSEIVAERKEIAARLQKLLEDRLGDGDAFDRAEQFEHLKERLERMAGVAFAGGAGRSPNGSQSPLA